MSALFAEGIIDKNKLGVGYPAAVLPIEIQRNLARQHRFRRQQPTLEHTPPHMLFFSATPAP